VALRSGAEAGVDRWSPPARRGLNLQTAGGGYSPWGVGTAREEEKDNPYLFGDFANQPLDYI
jgi:hypothetical protein